MKENQAVLKAHADQTKEEKACLAQAVADLREKWNVSKFKQQQLVQEVRYLRRASKVFQSRSQQVPNS